MSDQDPANDPFYGAISRYTLRNFYDGISVSGEAKYWNPHAIITIVDSYCSNSYLLDKHVLIACPLASAPNGTIKWFVGKVIRKSVNTIDSERCFDINVKTLHGYGDVVRHRLRTMDYRCLGKRYQPVDKNTWALATLKGDGPIPEPITLDIFYGSRKYEKNGFYGDQHVSDSARAWRPSVLDPENKLKPISEWNLIERNILYVDEVEQGGPSNGPSVHRLEWTHGKVVAKLDDTGYRVERDDGSTFLKYMDLGGLRHIPTVRNAVDRFTWAPAVSRAANTRNR